MSFASTPRAAGNRSVLPSRIGDEPTIVYVVEDDRDLREILTWLVEGGGYQCVACETGAQALERIVPKHVGCVLIDLSLPDMHGLELRRRLLANRCRYPFIVVTGSQDISHAVQSFKDGALDFVQKPFDRNQLLSLIHEAVRHDRSRYQVEARFNALTGREFEILRVLIAGRATKEIARDFGISPRTVDVHRHHILKKMGAHSIAELIHVNRGYDWKL